MPDPSISVANLNIVLFGNAAPPVGARVSVADARTKLRARRDALEAKATRTPAEEAELEIITQLLRGQRLEMIDDKDAPVAGNRDGFITVASVAAIAGPGVADQLELTEVTGLTGGGGAGAVRPLAPTAPPGPAPVPQNQDISHILNLFARTRLRADGRISINDLVDYLNSADPANPTLPPAHNTPGTTTPDPAAVAVRAELVTLIGNRNNVPPNTLAALRLLSGEHTRYLFDPQEGDIVIANLDRLRPAGATTTSADHITRGAFTRMMTTYTPQMLARLARGTEQAGAGNYVIRSRALNQYFYAILGPAYNPTSPAASQPIVNGAGVQMVLLPNGNLLMTIVRIDPSNANPLQVTTVEIPFEGLRSFALRHNYALQITDDPAAGRSFTDPHTERVLSGVPEAQPRPGSTVLNLNNSGNLQSFISRFLGPNVIAAVLRGEMPAGWRDGGIGTGTITDIRQMPDTAPAGTTGVIPLAPGGITLRPLTPP